MAVLRLWSFGLLQHVVLWADTNVSMFRFEVCRYRNRLSYGGR
jgi:hypothetical protein